MLDFICNLLHSKPKPELKINIPAEEPFIRTPISVQEYNKQYYERTKAKRKEKVICECGKKITREYMKKHKKTRFHINRMQKLNEI